MLHGNNVRCELRFKRAIFPIYVVRRAAPNVAPALDFSRFPGLFCSGLAVVRATNVQFCLLECEFPL